MAALAACGGATEPPPSPPPPPPPPPGAITLAPSVSSLNVQQGQQGAITVVISRSGSFTGSVTLSVESLPAGVSAPISNETTDGARTSFTVTFAASGSAAAVRKDLTLRAKGSGITDATALFSLTVTPAPQPGYELTLSGDALSLPQGTNLRRTITIARSGGFGGAVALTAEGVPAGLAVAVNPSSASGGDAAVTVFAAAGLAEGTYEFTVRGVAPGLADRTVKVQLTVTAVSASGNVILNFSTCGSPYAIWVAYRDGSGPWTRVTGTGGIFQFTVNSPLAAFTYVVRQGGSSATTVNVQYMTRVEMSKAPILFCPATTIGIKTVNGSVAALTAAQAVFLSMGGGFGVASQLFPTFTIAPILSGDRDLFAYRAGGLPSAADRLIVRRDLNLASGASLGVLDFAASEAAAPATATLTVLGRAGNEGMLERMNYLARTSCDSGMLYETGQTENSHVITGVPASLQRPTDLHQLRLSASTGSTSRVAQESFQVLGNRTVVLPEPLGNPTVRILSGGYKRLEAEFGLPVEQSHGAVLNYLQSSGGGAPRIVNVAATLAWVSSATAKLTMPDFAGVSGWSDTWGPASAQASRWTITANGATAGAPCVEGARVVQATASGSN